jgi:hypothetical protein
VIDAQTRVTAVSIKQSFNVLFREALNRRERGSGSGSCMRADYPRRCYRSGMAGFGKHPHGFRLQGPVRTLPSVRVRSGENQASDNGFQQFVTRFQAIEIIGQNQRDPLIPADANARAIDIDLAAADALPTFKNFSHYVDPTLAASCTVDCADAKAYWLSSAAPPRKLAAVGAGTTGCLLRRYSRGTVS